MSGVSFFCSITIFISVDPNVIFISERVPAFATARFIVPPPPPSPLLPATVIFISRTPSNWANAGPAASSSANKVGLILLRICFLQQYLMFSVMCAPTHDCQVLPLMCISVKVEFMQEAVEEGGKDHGQRSRSEEHTSELQSL